MTVKVLVIGIQNNWIKTWYISSNIYVLILRYNTLVLKSGLKHNRTGILLKEEGCLLTSVFLVQLRSIKVFVNAWIRIFYIINFISDNNFYILFHNKETFLVSERKCNK